MKQFLFILLFFFLTACTTTPSVILAGKTINVEIADSSEEQRIGLMNRTTLSQDHGMLFIFPDEQQRYFWMKNTLIPLDIIFIDSNLNIINVHTAEPCTQEPCLIYDSTKPAKYVLEVNAGYAEKHGIKPGQEARLSNI